VAKTRETMRLHDHNGLSKVNVWNGAVKATLRFAAGLLAQMLLFPDNFTAHLRCPGLSQAVAAQKPLNGQLGGGAPSRAPAVQHPGFAYHTGHDPHHKL